MADGDGIGRRITTYRRPGAEPGRPRRARGRSESWLSQVERPVRSVDRMSVLLDLARVVHVDVEALVGRPWQLAPNGNTIADAMRPFQPASAVQDGGLQNAMRAEAGTKWIEMGLVFTTRIGTPLDAADVRRDFRAAIRRAPGIDAGAWTPRELRHSVVSLLSDSGVPIEEISRLVGHRSSLVTETVYRKQLLPVIQSGATAMDRLFASGMTGIGGH